MWSVVMGQWTGALRLDSLPSILTKKLGCEKLFARARPFGPLLV